MRARYDRRSTRSRVVRSLFVVLFVLLLTMGGSSRYNAATLFVLRPLLVLVTAGLMLMPPGELGRATRVPAILLGLFAAVITAQLVPLPFAIWAALPGRGGDVAVATWLGEAQPWRPLSIVPVLTWNSLLALLPAGAGLVAASRLDRRDLHFVLVVLVGCWICSALLGVIQIGGGVGYLYSPNSPGLPTGAFANRNHQAAFLAGLLPLLAVWASLPGQRIATGVRHLLAGIVATLFVITVLITGSRTGLALMLLDMVGAGLIVMRARPKREAGGPLMLIAAFMGVLAGLVAVAVYLGRGGGVDRFAAFDAGAEMRVQALPVVRGLLARYFPWGSGFGTFDPLFRAYEPDRLLKPTYFNNAHNDLIELMLTGGIPALALLAVLLGWMGLKGVVVARTWKNDSPLTFVSLAAAMMAATWLLASLPDYPLRTPLASATFALACCVMSAGKRPSRAGL